MRSFFIISSPRFTKTVSFLLNEWASLVKKNLSCSLFLLSKPRRWVYLCWNCHFVIINGHSASWIDLGFRKRLANVHQGKRNANNLMLGLLPKLSWFGVKTRQLRKERDTSFVAWAILSSRWPDSKTWHWQYLIASVASGPPQLSWSMNPWNSRTWSGEQSVCWNLPSEF